MAGARDTLMKSKFTFQDINPKDDLQFRRITSQQGAFKKNITLAIKKAEDLHENIKKLTVQPGMLDQCRIKTGMITTGVGYLDSARRELDNLSEANEVFNQMLDELILIDPKLEKECDEKRKSAEEAWDRYNTTLMTSIQKTALLFQSSPSTSAPNSRENSPQRPQILQRRTVNTKHLMPSVLGAECNTKEYRKFKCEFTL